MRLLADRRLNSVKSAGRHVSAEPTGLTTALCVHTWEYQMVLTYSVQSWVIWGIHQARKLTYTLTWGVVARKSEVSPFSKKVKKFLPFCTPACWVIHLPPRCWSAHSYSLGPCHPHLVRSGVQELSVCAAKGERNFSEARMVVSKGVHSLDSPSPSITPTSHGAR